MLSAFKAKASRLVKLIRAMTSCREQFVLNNFMGDVNYNFGCGNRPIAGFINADHFLLEFADINLDLEAPIPLPDESVDLIWSDNVFEHVQNFRQLMNECQRILKKSGWLAVRVPYYKCSSAFTDPTHCHFFSIGSFDSYVEGWAFDRHPLVSKPFAKKMIFLEPNKSRDSFFWNLISAYAHQYPYRYENGIVGVMYPFEAITFALKK